MNTKMKVIIIAVVSVIILNIISVTSNAASMKVDVNFDGKKIKMTSETPDMTWNINNLLPGETDITYLTINNTGKKQTEIKFTATLEEGKELAEILDIEIIKLANSNNVKDETVFVGKYKDISKLSFSVDNKTTQDIKIVTTMPIEAGNEYQNKNCKIKIGLTALGEEGTQTEEITPPEEVQTGESRMIFVVGGILIITIVAFAISFWIKKKEK